MENLLPSPNLGAGAEGKTHAAKSFSLNTNDGCVRLPNVPDVTYLQENSQL
nr:hypothetical protein [Nostoc sp. EfeVER01]